MSGSIIAFSGKGGSGKTTVTSMVLRQLIRMGQKPLLAVDADPNATLGLTLGAEVDGTIADLRDEMYQAAQQPGHIPKERLLDKLMAELLTEEAGFDLLTMGRPEGQRCYCYVNGLLRRYLSILRENYSCILVDCEAGMEYLSRLVVDDLESLVFVSEATPVGLTTAKRITELADSLGIKVRRRILALNKVNSPGRGATLNRDNHRITGMDAVIEIPFDGDVAQRCDSGISLDDSAGSQARRAIESLAAWCIGRGAD